MKKMETSKTGEEGTRQTQSVRSCIPAQGTGVRVEICNGVARVSLSMFHMWEVGGEGVDCCFWARFKDQGCGDLVQSEPACTRHSPMSQKRTALLEVWSRVARQLDLQDTITDAVDTAP